MSSIPSPLPRSAGFLITPDMCGYTSLTALTRGVYLSLSGGTTLETIGKFQGAYKLSVGNRTGIWLECGMRSTKEAVGV